MIFDWSLSFAVFAEIVLLVRRNQTFGLAPGPAPAPCLLTKEQNLLKLSSQIVCGQFEVY